MLGGNVYPPDSNREENSETNGSYWILQIAAYGFLAIISLITVLNIKNSISMGVSARVKQYGAVRAVGMENRQVTIAVGIVRYWRIVWLEGWKIMDAYEKKAE